MSDSSSSDGGSAPGGGGMGMGGRQMAAAMMQRMPMNPGMRPPANPGAMPMAPPPMGGPHIPADPAAPMRVMGAGPFPHGDLDLRNIGFRAPPVGVRPHRPLSGRNFYFLQQLPGNAAAAPLAPVAQGMAAPANVPVPAAGDGAKKG